MLNLLHVLPAFADEGELRLNAIVELNSGTINKYELITETGHLKLDRVGYSSLAYPFAYGCIPRTWDEDGDPLDIGFNISYLLDVLNHVDAATLTVTMGDSNSSALVQIPGNDDFKYVVMPMRI